MSIVISRQPTTQIPSGNKLYITSSVYSTTGKKLNYAWKKNNASIPAQTSSIFLIQSASVSDSGTYTLTISDGNNTVNTNPSYVLVYNNPSPTTGSNNTGSNNPPTGSTSGSIITANIINVPKNLAVGSSAPIAIQLSNINTPTVTLWESSNQQSALGDTFILSPTKTGTQWIESETTVFDGRRLYSSASYFATETVTNTIETYNPNITTDTSIKSWFKLDGTLLDEKNFSPSLIINGNTTFDGHTFVWSNRPNGQCLYCNVISDSVNLAIPAIPLTKYLSVECMIKIGNYNSRGVGNSTVFSLFRNWSDYFTIGDNIWNGPSLSVYNQVLLNASQFLSIVPPNVWTHLKLLIDTNGYSFYINGNLQTTYAKAGAVSLWSGVTSNLTLGGENGWFDELIIKAE